MKAHRFDRLFVLWHGPSRKRMRHVIGELRREPDGYAFTYDERAKAAAAAGFRPLVEFPRLRKEPPYRSAYLFSTFARGSRRRSDPTTRSCSGNGASSMPTIRWKSWRAAGAFGDGRHRVE